MNEQRDCEQVLMAKMSELDGEQALDSEMAGHLATCENCRRESAAMQDLNGLFGKHSRAEGEINIWLRVEERISRRSRALGWQPFAAISAALVVFKFVEMSLRNDPGYLFGLIPLVLAALLFIVLRENPFKVNADLVME